MRRSFFIKRNSEVNDVKSSSKLDLQMSLVNHLLIGVILLGLVLFVTNMANFRSSGWFANQLVYGLGIVWLFVIFKARRFTYKARVFSLLVIVAVIGQVVLFTKGLNGSASLFFLMLPFFSVLFLGRREAIIALVLCGLSMVITVVTINNQLIANPDPIEFHMVTRLWIDSGINFFLVAILMTISVSAIMTGLEKGREREKTLLAQVKEEQTIQSDNVATLTEKIRNRLELTKAAADICGSIYQLIEPKELLDQVVELVKERFDLYFVGVFIIEENRSGITKSALLCAGSGDAGQQMCHAGYRLAVDTTSMIGWAIMNQQARVTHDTVADAVHFNNPFLPLTRSELVLPLTYGERVLGAMTFQSELLTSFDDEDIPVFKSMADALANAYENSQIFSEANRNLEEARSLNRQYVQQSWRQFGENQGDLSFDYVNEPGNSDMVINQTKLPLSLRDQVIGEITLEREDSSLSEEERAFAEAVTNQAVLALENARLLEATQRRAEKERLVSDITRQVRASNELEAIMRITIQELGRVLSASEGIIHLEGKTPNEFTGFDPKMVDAPGSRS